jgi:hypothetical protein
MRTNQREQACENCEILVAPGEGRLEHYSREWLEDNDEFTTRPGWHVTCLDEAACKARVAARASARKEAAERLSRARAALRKLWDQVWAGEYPPKEDAPAAGEELFCPGSGNRLYGGGEWFLLQSDWIWAVRNNGMDGDDWRANNVRTGGAGAIGHRVPATPELSAAIRQAVAALAAELRS